MSNQDSVQTVISELFRSKTAREVILAERLQAILDSQRPKRYKNLSAEYLKSVLHYDPDTGIFTWLQNKQKSLVGKIAGSVSVTGYIRIMVRAHEYRAHRLAWFYTYVAWPSIDVDHINGIRSDNRICNLREATLEHNAQNLKRPRKQNKSGFLGVKPTKNGERFMAHLAYGGKNYYLGTFDTAEQAHATYVEQKRLHHPGNTL